MSKQDKHDQNDKLPVTGRDKMRWYWWRASGLRSSLHCFRFYLLNFSTPEKTTKRTPPKSPEKAVVPLAFPLFFPLSLLFFFSFEDKET